MPAPTESPAICTGKSYAARYGQFDSGVKHLTNVRVIHSDTTFGAHRAGAGAVHSATPTTT